MSLIEGIFLREHRIQIYQKCTPTLSSCSLKELPNIITELWETVVYPSEVHQLLDDSTIDSLRVIFSSVIRVCCDVDALVAYLIEEIPPLISNSTNSSEIMVFVYKMNQFGLAEEVNKVLQLAIPKQISTYIKATWSYAYLDNTVELVSKWINSVLIPEVQKILVDTDALVPVAEVFNVALHSLGKLRISELSYIVEHEELRGIHDLQQAIKANPGLRTDVVMTFNSYCNSFLLNGASDTVDIILLYLRTITAFSKLDPQGVLLEKVSTRIKQVLQERSDTCARLAEGLFGLPSSPLSFLADGIKQMPSTLTRKTVADSFRNWEPDPIDTPADYVRKLTKDSVSTLINIFDNKGVFVQQLAILYADELLNLPISDDLTELEKLKSHFEAMSLRFSNTPSINNIRVMFTDYTKSCEMALQIHKSAPHLKNIAPLVLSRLFWPSHIFSKRKNAGTSSAKFFNVPRHGNFKNMLDDYAQQYRQIEGHEQLDLLWLHDKGRVTIKLELKDRTLDLVVQPDQATLISVFDEDHNTESLTFAELLNATDFDEQQLLHAIQFWMDHGVIGTDGEKYRVLETEEDVQAQANNHVVLTESEQNQNTDMFEDMHQYWSYIVGMLTNLGSLPTDRIHSFLVMFVPSEDPYMKNKQELESYLLAMVDEGKLNYEDSKFSLRR